MNWASMDASFLSGWIRAAATISPREDRLRKGPYPTETSWGLSPRGEDRMDDSLGRPYFAEDLCALESVLLGIVLSLLIIHITD